MADEAWLKYKTRASFGRNKHPIDQPNLVLLPTLVLGELLAINEQSATQIVAYLRTPITHI